MRTALVFIALLAAPGAPAQESLGSLKNLRLGMSLAELKALEGGGSDFRGGDFRCAQQDDVVHCTAARQTVAELPATVTASFTAVSGRPAVQSVRVPPPYEPSAAERRLLDPQALRARQAARARERKAALARQAQVQAALDAAYALARIEARVQAAQHDVLRKALVAKFGEPFLSKEEEPANGAAAGAPPGLRTVWRTPPHRIELLQRCEAGQHSCVRYTHDSLTKILLGTIDEAHARRARDL